MNIPFKLTTIAAVITILAGCQTELGATIAVDSGPVYYEPSPPYLANFHIVDTYGIDTQFDVFTPLFLSPYINAGKFEVSWYVDSEVDYNIELRINNTASLAGSRLISTDYCTAGGYCDSHNYQYCDYRADFSITCETPNGFTDTVGFGDMLVTVPQPMHLIFQVCEADYGYCEYQTRRVTLE